jgi:hypothetical protein
MWPNQFFNHFFPRKKVCNQKFELCV